MLFCPTSVAGLCHISEIAIERIRSIERFLQPGDKIDVKLISIDKSTGKLQLSRKAVLQDAQGTVAV